MEQELAEVARPDRELQVDDRVVLERDVRCDAESVEHVVVVVGRVRLVGNSSRTSWCTRVRSTTGGATSRPCSR